LKSRGIPAAVSQTAGTFVCNHVFYGLMHALRETTGVRGGFIHVPWLPEQAAENQPSLPLTVMVEAIGETIAVSLRARRPPQVSR
jgi:pyroglutamyl-peptidase